MNLLRKLFGGQPATENDVPSHLAVDTAVPAQNAPQATVELEEQIELLNETPPDVLAAGSELTVPDGRVIRIESFLESRGGRNIYAAHLRDAQANTEQENTQQLDTGQALRLYETEGEDGRALESEAAIGSMAGEGTLSSLPLFFSQGNKHYLLDEASRVVPTLAELFESNAPLESTLPVLLATARATAKLHENGWMHGGLHPEIISSNFAAPIGGVSGVVKIGHPLDAPLFHGEYSAPELAKAGAIADARADVYSLGVLFYRTLAGASLETIQNDEALQRRVFAISGVPQILTYALAAPEARFQNAGEMYEVLERWAARREPQPEYSIAVASVIGLNTSRTANEDAALHLSGGLTSEFGQTRWALIAVADGMGGMDAGEAASHAAVHSLAQSATSLALLDELPALETQSQWTLEWAHQAAAAVANVMQKENARGGCTLVAALAIGNRFTLAHAGDCRAYIFSTRESKWQILTRDHSYVATLWQAGEIAWEELRTHPARNQITRALGERAEVPEWFFDSLEIATGKVSHSLAPGEVLLLCSDGAWEPVLEDEMAKIIQENFPNLNAAANAILQLALERGAPDNATVALLAMNS